MTGTAITLARAAAQLRTFIIQEGFDLVDAHLDDALLVAVPAAVAARVPVVVTLYHVQTIPASPVLQPFRLASLWMVNGIVTDSKARADEFAQNLPRSVKSIYTIPNGVKLQAPLECPACFVPMEERHIGQGEHMGRGKKYQPEQVVKLLRQVEVAVANGKTTAQACKEAGIVKQTYFRWRKEYGGLQVDQAKRLKELEQENAKLKRLVANLSLDNLVLKDFASGNF